MNSGLNVAMCGTGTVHFSQTLRRNINVIGLLRTFDERTEEHHHQIAASPPTGFDWIDRNVTENVRSGGERL
jgi:hypothetical protein